jgi:hypothetical protein
MSALNPTVRFQAKSGVEGDSENGSSSPLDEGAILLENQVNTPNDEGQNMASPSVNMEPTKNKMRDGSSIVDMVMVYEVPDPSTLDTEKEQQQEADKNTIRDFYINALKAADLLVETDQLAIAKAEVYSSRFIIHFVFVFTLNSASIEAHGSHKLVLCRTACLAVFYFIFVLG